MASKTITIVIDDSRSDAEIRQCVKRGFELLTWEDDDFGYYRSLGIVQRLVGIDRHEAGTKKAKARKRKAK